MRCKPAMELTISAGDLPPTTIPLFATATAEGQTVYMPGSMATTSTLGKHAQPAHVQAAIERSIDEARKPRSFALFFVSAWTQWRPFLWQCVDTEKEAEEGSLLLNTFLRSTAAPFAKTWAVSTDVACAHEPFAIIDGNTPGGIIEAEPVASIDCDSRKTARIDTPTPSAPALINIAEDARLMAQRTHAKLWGASVATGETAPDVVADADMVAGVDSLVTTFGDDTVTALV
jgi:hypothetical protein